MFKKIFLILMLCNILYALDSSRIFPKAWEKENINDVLEVLYGKNFRLIDSKGIELKLIKKKFVANGDTLDISIKSSIPAKSLAVLHQEKNNKVKTLAHFFKIDNRLIDYEISLYAGEQGGLKEIIVVLEGVDGKFYRTILPISVGFGCYENEKDYMSDILSRWKKNDRNRYKHRMKVIKEKNITSIDLKVYYNILSERKAKELNQIEDYFSHIQAKIEEEIVYDLYSSSNFGSKPHFKFKYTDLNNSQSIDIMFENSNAEKMFLFQDFEK